MLATRLQNEVKTKLSKHMKRGRASFVISALAESPALSHMTMGSMQSPADMT